LTLQDKTVFAALDSAFETAPTALPARIDAGLPAPTQRVEDDFEQARDTLRNLISKGEQALDGMMDVARQSDHPRAYEVTGQLIKTVAETAKDLLALQTECEEAGINNIMDALKSEEGQHPLIVRCYLRKTVQIETLVILNKLLQWTDAVDATCGDTLMWPDLRRLIHKYSPFLKIKEDEYRSIVQRIA
jgi:hypothetical protein